MPCETAPLLFSPHRLEKAPPEPLRRFLSPLLASLGKSTQRLLLHPLDLPSVPPRWIWVRHRRHRHLHSDPAGLSFSFEWRPSPHLSPLPGATGHRLRSPLPSPLMRHCRTEPSPPPHHHRAVRWVPPPHQVAWRSSFMPPVRAPPTVPHEGRHRAAASYPAALVIGAVTESVRTRAVHGPSTPLGRADRAGHCKLAPRLMAQHQPIIQFCFLFISEFL
jgi:hypothetical protein